MVFGEDVPVAIDRRIDTFLREWGIPMTNMGYRYLKQLIAYVILHPGVNIKTAMEEISHSIGIDWRNFQNVIANSIKSCTPPQYANGIDYKPTVKRFVMLCVNTVLME